MLEIKLDEIDRKEFETVEKYLRGKFDDLGKKNRHKTTEDNPKQLIQMANTITRALALATVK